MSSEFMVGSGFTSRAVYDIIRDMSAKEWDIVKDTPSECIVDGLTNEQKAVCKKHVYDLVRQSMEIRNTDDIEMKVWVVYCYKVN
jgi:hypothetical protein